MDIVVCIKQVPGTNKAEVDPETGVIRRDPLDSKMNPYDLYAVETALRLREEHGGRVRVVTMGPLQAADMIREAYSLGADEGVLLTDRRFAGSDVLATSYALSQAIEASGHFDLIICGKQTTDGDTAQVGPEIAEHLGLPSAAGVVRISDVTPDSMVIEMDMPTTVEQVRISLPCLISVEREICVPRLPSYLRKLATADREVRTLTFDDLRDRDEKKYGLNGSPTQVRRIFPPEQNTANEIWTGSADELAERLFAALRERKFTGGGRV